MNEDIKEILDRIKKHYVLDEEQDIILLNYITNLQEENEELNRIVELYGKSLYNADLTRYKEENIKLKETNEEHRRINGELRKENQKLVKVIDELEEYILNHYIVGHTVQNASLDDILNKLTELKGGNND